MLQIISATCSAFIRRGVISCKVISATRQYSYSADLSQGGMEVPYKQTDKLRKLLPHTNFKETSFLSLIISKSNTDVVPAIVTNPTVILVLYL